MPSPLQPANFRVRVFGLDSIAMSWDAVEGDIAHYVFAIGSGTSHPADSDIRYWQSLATRTSTTEHVMLTEGRQFYVSVYAIDTAGQSGEVARSGPHVAQRQLLGQEGYTVECVVAPQGVDAAGQPCATWPDERVLALRQFLDRMVPILTELYGPPSVPYTLNFVRDLRYTASAMFVPSVDEIRLGDTAHYQLITHEMVHAWRNDRLLAADRNWAYDPTFCGFEEAFAHGVSYDAMQRFAERYPDFDLGQTRFASSFAWDYDFHNSGELTATDFWTSNGGTLIHWARYEMAAAAINKIQTEHPSFYADFNHEFYRRLNREPALRVSRELIVDVIASVAPVIEGQAARQWVNAQRIFDCFIRPGKKVWINTQHYPQQQGDYFVLNTIHGYETFANGSEWAHGRAPDYVYHSLNGSRGRVTVRDDAGQPVEVRLIQLAPAENPPLHNGYGTALVNLTTQAGPEPWAAGDPANLVTGINEFGLYSIEVELDLGGVPVRQRVHRVVGDALRNARGVWGGILGADGGTIALSHSAMPGEVTSSPVVRGAFHCTPPWASAVFGNANAPASLPGVVTAVYRNRNGRAFSARRNIRSGGPGGSQIFLFDVATMKVEPGFGAAHGAFLPFVAR